MKDVNFWMPGKFPLLVYLSSFAESGLCDEEQGMKGEQREFANRKIPQSQEKQEDLESCRLGTAASAGRCSQMFEQKMPVGFPTSILVLHQLIFRLQTPNNQPPIPATHAHSCR